MITFQNRRHRNPASRPGACFVLFVSSCFIPVAALMQGEDRIPQVAVITTEWRHNAHADVIGSRLVQGYTLDGKGEFPKLKLVSAYVDQFPANDMSRRLASEHGFVIHDSVAKALTLGGDKLAVDGVLLIAEHGNYPESATGSIQYPKRRLFAEIVKVFEASGRVVPVFSDKHLEDDWQDIAWFWGEAQRLKIPLMAGSSLPTLWRYPEADVERGAPLKEIVATSYGRLDSYGFHALEMVQCLVERRKSGGSWGETGVKQVRCLEGEAVWEAGRQGVYDRTLLAEALSRLKNRPLPAEKTLEEVSRRPVLYVVDYRDGLKASILTPGGGIGEWTVAWRYGDGRTQATCFATQEARPYMHFTYLLKGVESMIHTGQPVWPAERTLLTSGTLDALLTSRKRGGEMVATPQLNIAYKSNWTWQMPPPPPPNRPSRGQ